MTVRLVPLAPSDFSRWLALSSAAYEADLITTGMTAEAAQGQAKSSLTAAFPENTPSASNAVFNIVETTGTVVGYVWVGTDTSPNPQAWWVWDIAVDAAHRGRGYGKAAMELAETYARSEGASTLGLSVFGFNKSARGLYESLGYETTSIKMRKNLEALTPNRADTQGAAEHQFSGR